ncbi:thiosulfate/3-mercaptopyruvate sulfurtransferase [Nocardioides thalensis]|uniref:Thiosulfate/3-mercaptopyruvate sulfurtransferase n=1 Tax=Nocardioides thalensis TaxID=1914755 RepID=A0A853BYM8_9ACTN|nr:sulfurtransferase [Nocardioides thalensis]NYJ01060.1 thiosulfate/3-mercaptopyruvate sulfurtransferase [Nocardioides thalensis]
MSLISAAELSDLLGTVTVLDVRYRMGGSGPSGREAFAAGHVPGAAYVDLDTALAAPPGAGGRHPLPEPEAFAAAMRAAGVRREVPVVVYDDWAGHAAARCWWLLRHHGHRDVRVLDGAWPAWTASGGAVETGPGGPVAPGDFVAEPGRQPVVDADEVRDVDVLVDARAPERFRGETEPVDPVAGRIPGAVNVPTARNLAADGRFRDLAGLRAAYDEVGALGGGTVAVYCGSGVTAAHDVLALDLLGVRAALYPGSWSGWITDPERPVERG